MHKTMTTTRARASLYQLIEQVAASHEPVLITGKTHNAVLVSEKDWESIQETLYLVSIPGMVESIQAGLATPMTACDDELDW